ncbi:MAG: hypothetical protein PHF60_02650 [Candidatus ainarchaeum sp.]|nr:hypothetical protein [Candidatus ainarchaeum sp.]
MRTPAAILTLIGLLMLSGCLQQLGGGSVYSSAYINGLNPQAISSPDMIGECQLGTCWCMACRNGTNLFGPMENLIGGSCHWETNCTASKFADINNNTKNPDLSSRQFMLGQGPTFSDFAVANTYCGNQLSMAVQWLPAIGQTSYLEPDSLRAMCMLSKNVIPVYVLYSGGNNIDATQAGKIAKKLYTEGDDFFLGRLSDGPVGPVIIVVEPDLEPDFDQSKVAQVAEVVRAIDQECNPNRASGNITCYIAISPKMGDFDTLNDIMDEPDMATSVDLIAYGINGSSVHSCEGSAIRMQALNFSAYALYNLSKPSIIPYVLFDVGTHDADNSCEWTESRVATAYGSFFPTALQSLRAKGVIGMAPYSFNLTSSIPIVNPLNCSDCGVARTDGRLSGWYGGCQAYSVLKNASGDLVPRGKSSILFSNGSGGSCIANGGQFDYFSSFSFRDKDIMQPQPAGAPEGQTELFACDACLLTNTTRDVMDMFNFNVESAPTITDADCTAFKAEIDAWSGARNIDPTLYRAVVKTESNFDQCAAARSCRSGYSGDSYLPPCFPTGEGYANGYDAMFDPTGTCVFQNANPFSSPIDWRWIGLGMTQTLVPPSTFWPGTDTSNGLDGPNYDIFDKAGFDTPDFRATTLQNAKDCNPDFNPFVPGDSICLGTLTYQQKFEAAKDLVSTYHTQGRLNWQSTDEEKDRVFATYIALEKYAGFWDKNLRDGGATTKLNPGCSSSESDGECWTRTFKESFSVTTEWCNNTENQDETDYEIKCEGDEPRQDPPPQPASQSSPAPTGGPYYCYGYTDFVQFVHDCHMPFLFRKTDPAAVKMATYVALSEHCTTFCPEGKSLMEALGLAVPASGTAYLPDSVMAEGG